MKTRAFLLALPLLAIAGCRDNRASIQIQAVCAPTDNCSFSGTCDAQYIGFATVDSTRTDHLWLLLQVENQLPDNTDRSVGKLNTNDAHIDQVVVEYDGIGLGRAVVDVIDYRVPASGSSVISVEAIPASLNATPVLTSFAPTTATRTMVANVRLRGFYDDGSRFETGEFPVGIRVCAGCLTAATGLCPTAATCPPASNGQLPIVCL